MQGRRSQGTPLFPNLFATPPALRRGRGGCFIPFGDKTFQNFQPQGAPIAEEGVVEEPAAFDHPEPVQLEEQEEIIMEENNQQFQQPADNNQNAVIGER